MIIIGGVKLIIYLSSSDYTVQTYFCEKFESLDNIMIYFGILWNIVQTLRTNELKIWTVLSSDDILYTTIWQGAQLG